MGQDRKATEGISDYRIELGTRLREVEKLFRNREIAANAAGVSKSALQKWIEGKAAAPMERLRELAQNAGVSMNWLATGEGEMHTGLSERPKTPFDHTPVGGPQNPNRKWVVRKTYYPDKLVANEVSVTGRFTPIACYTGQTDAGHGTRPNPENTRSPLMFPTSWLPSGGPQPSDLLALNPCGNSMEPTIMDGALVLVNTADKGLKDGGIYVINVAGDLLIKRILRHVTGDITLRSDNPSYSDQQLAMADIHSLNIVGRIVWSANTY